MNIAKLILNYQKRGIKLTVVDGRLHFSAPQNTLTNEDKSILKEHKEKIIYYLLQNNESEIIVNEEDKYEEFPLTDIQASYLIGQDNVYKFGGTNCKIYTEIGFEELDLEKAQYAWEEVVKHNDMLHAVIKKSGVQKILKIYKVPQIGYSDLSKEDDIQSLLNNKRVQLTKKQYEAGTWPLFDVEISKLKDSYVFHISLDMLIADFVSINLILDEFEEMYYTGTIHSKIGLSFRDIVIYRDNIKNTVKEKEKYEKDKDYWLKKINTMPGMPYFPIRESQNEEVIFTQHKVFLETRKYKRLCEIANHYQVTPSSIILVAYSEALKQISKNKAFCIDITMVDRPPIHPHINKIVGDFTVASILEIEDDDCKTYLDKVKIIQKRLWDDLSHNSFSSREVLRELGKKEKGEIIVPAVYTSTLGAVDYNSKRKGKILYTISQTPQVLIDCQVLEIEKGLRMNWDVREAVFPKGLIKEAFESFCTLVYQIIDKNDLESEICFKLPNNVKERRKEVNCTLEIFEKKNLHEGFFENVKYYSERNALHVNGIDYTYREVFYYANSIMKALELQGIAEGDIVAVAVSKGIWQIASILGIMAKGGAYLPLDVHQPSERAEKIVGSANVKCCILEKEDYIGSDIIEKINIQKLDKIISSNINYMKIDRELPAYVIFTSGSTGTPKGVVISHAAATNTILDINKKYRVEKNDKILNISNLGFDLSVYDIFGAFFAGAEVIQVNEEQAKDPEHWYNLLKEEKVTIFNGVPGQMKMLTMFLEGKKETILEHVRLILLSGDWIPTDLPKIIIKFFPNATIISLGGATEAAIWSIYYPIDVTKEYERSIPYGKPLANQRFYILNEDGEEVLDWITGDIYIAGDGLAIGYLGDKELTDKKFIYSKRLKERLYKTGDIGRYMPDGNIEFQGRSDFQVKIRGHRVELGEIESAIAEILHPDDLKVIAVKDAEITSICMFAVLEKKKKSFSKEKLESQLLRKIPQYMIPTYYEYLDKIPLNVNGKVDIKALAKRGLDGIKKNRCLGCSTEKLSDTEEKVYRVWTNIFNTQNISVDEDFFECGGDSILIVKLLTELENKYKYKLSLMDVYAAPTIRKMAECIGKNNNF